MLVEHWSAGSSGKLRQLSAADLLKAAADVRPSVAKAQQYSQGMHGSASFDAGSGRSGLGMAQLMAALAASASSSRGAAGASNGAAGSSSKSREADGSDDVEAAALSEEDARRDEMYKLIGKMVLGSLGAVPQ